MEGILRSSRVTTSSNPKTSGENRIRWSAVLEAVAAANVLFPVAIFALTVAGFALGFRMHGWILPVAALLTLLGLRLFTASWRMTGFVAGASVGLLLMAYLFACHFYDDSWDGLDYHQNAVLCFSEGWNPFIGSSGVYGPQNDTLWDDHYPEAAWITGAAIFMDTGRIESGKLLHFTLMAAAAAQFAAVLLRLTRLRLWKVALLAALAALNPVSVYQSTAFYVDGMLASLLTVLASALFLYVAKPRWQTLSIALAAMSLAINLKFTGLIYVIVLVGAASVILYSRTGLRAARPLAVAGVVAVLFATFGLGYAPYVRNISTQSNMFYPVLGAHDKNHQYHLDEFIPANIAPHNRVMRFLISNFSRSERIRPPFSATPKIPFAIYHSLEGAAFQDPDVEVAGFGPLYGGLLVLSVLGLGLLAADRSAWRHLTIAALITGVLLVSIFSHQESWWARYVPQAWLLPLVMAVTCLLTSQRLGRRWLAWAMIALISLDVLFVGFYFGRGECKYTRMTHDTLREMSASSQPITVYLGTFPSLGQRLLEAGVHFQTVSTPPIAASPLTGWQAIPSPSQQAWWMAGP